MKTRVLLLILAVGLLCSGCSTWLDGSYYSVTPHAVSQLEVQTDALSASDYSELNRVLWNLVDTGTEKAVINVAEFKQATLEVNLGSAVRYLQEYYPLGAYAVESVEYEIGVGSGGQPVVSVDISYRHDRSELRRVRKVTDSAAVRQAIEEAIANCSDSVVLLVENYLPLDIQQLAEDYGMLRPEIVMEIPQVTAVTYPEQGIRRVLEVKFTYQTSREALRQMLSQVTPVFSSAQLYISAEDADYQKYAQLCAFLMERFDYRLETSITPAYSLLRHGVGDSRAFATVYAAMCRQVGLECQVISGTCAGEARCWNLIRDNKIYYHVDLLRSPGTFQELTDREMTDYVWDYSAYPATGE